MNLHTSLPMSSRPITAADRRGAARHLASAAHDADDLRLLLDALGLSARDGLADTGPEPVPGPACEPPAQPGPEARALGAALVTDIGTAMSRGRR